MMMQLVVSRVALVSVCAASSPCRASYSAVTSSSWAAKNGSSPGSPSEEICSVTWPVRREGQRTLDPPAVEGAVDQLRQRLVEVRADVHHLGEPQPQQGVLRAAEDPQRGLVEVDDHQVVPGLVGLEEGHADQRLGEVAAEQLAVGGDPVEQHRVALDGDAERQHQQRGAGQVALGQGATASGC